MATTITIQVGAVTATRSFADDAKARAALLKFYESQGLGAADASNPEKLTAVLDWFLRHVRAEAITQHTDAARKASRTEAESAYGFE